MIGQTKILKWVDNNINSFPHFIVLVGSHGCGKQTLCREIAHKISCVYSKCEIKVDNVREVIDTAYAITERVMYCFADADNMKAQAKNAMLKITEEPPKNAYFCLTVSDDSSLLATIKSRANVIYLEEYKNDELAQYYYEGASNGNEEECKLFCTICSTPGEIDKLTQYGKDFYDYVELVLENIAEVEPANAFKSSNKISLKTDDGYDLGLFFKTFVNICLDRLSDKTEDIIKYCDGIKVTTKYLNKVNNLGVNKQQLYDMWVFDIRQAWCE